MMMMMIAVTATQWLCVDVAESAVRWRLHSGCHCGRWTVTVGSSQQVVCHCWWLSVTDGRLEHHGRHGRHVSTSRRLQSHSAGRRLSQFTGAPSKPEQHQRLFWRRRRWQFYV